MLIRENKLFKGVSKEFLDEIEKMGEKISYEKGRYLFRTGDPATHFYILQEGRICICAEKQGHAVSFVYVPGDFFGWSSLLDRAHYSASAECVIPSTVITFKKEQLNNVLQHYPENGLLFYKNFASIIGGRFIESYHVKDWFPSIET